jgi:outer membrane protein assembly factor BamB
MRTALATVILLVLCPGAPRSLPAEDWPQFRGPTGQGISTETGLPTEWSADTGIAWSTPIPGQGWSSPIVHGDRVFVTTATEEGSSLRLISLDRATGKIHWNVEVVKQGLESRLQQGNSYATPTPVTDGRHTYVVAFDGSLAAVANDGSVAWTNRDFPYYSQHGIAVSPRVYGDLLVVPFDASSQGEDKKVGFQKPWEKSFILALDKRKGEVRWKASRGLSRIGHVTPNLAREGDRDVLVSGAGDVVQGFDLASGERLWTARSQGEGVVPSVVVGDGMVYTASGFEEPTIRAVRTGGRGDVTATHIAWEQTRAVPMMPSFLYVAPHVFTINESGLAMCLDAQTGEVLGRRRVGGNHSASPILAEGRIYFLSEEGETTVVEASPTMPLVARNTLPDLCKASLAVSGGRIFLRTETTLYCITAR